MGRIIVLDENTSNKIAAGEVIERPASVVKEMVENAIDAGATNISVEIRNGGISYIKISDNGSGMDEDDVEIAFERHATSKIKNADDLETIGTLGFRGEALASIASVASVELTTRVAEKSHGTHIHIKGGKVQEVKQTGCPVGTTFVVRDLFYNTPARFKFLKKDATEAGYISDMLNRVALSKPQISFKLISNHVTILHTPGNNDLLSVIFSIYGKETAKGITEIHNLDPKIKISGYAGKPEIARANRNQQSIFVNGRYIKSRIITSAIDEAYKTILMKNKFPFIVLNLEINPLLVDVNVHPTKMEIRFSEEQEIFRSIFHAVNNALLDKNLIKVVPVEVQEQKPFLFERESIPKTQYTQQNLNLNNSWLREKPVSTPVQNIKPVGCRDTGLQNENVKPEESKQVPAQVSEQVSAQVSEPSTVKAVAPQPMVIKPVTGIAKQTIDEQNDMKASVASEKTPLFHNAKIIGQAFSTYILLQQEKNLLLIDQHAAHERIMFETLKEKYLKTDSLSQELLSPLAIELTNQEIKFLEEEKEFFEQLGFKYDHFGNNAIILRALPYTDTEGSAKATFLEVLDTLIHKGKQDYKKIADDTLYTIACKAAVKANKHLDELEIRSLLESLSRLENPFTCPHGRPTVIKLTQYDLEKMFKRIV